MPHPFPLIAATTLFLAPLNARLELSNGWLDFGQLEVGDTALETIELRNTGDRPVTIFDIDFLGDDAFQIDGGDCEKTLEPGDSCEIEVEFLPEEPGSFEGELEVETSVGELDAQLSGEGAPSNQEKRTGGFPCFL